MTVKVSKLGYKNQEAFKLGALQTTACTRITILQVHTCIPILPLLISFLRCARTVARQILVFEAAEIDKISIYVTHYFLKQTYIATVCLMTKAGAYK